MSSNSRFILRAGSGVVAALILTLVANSPAQARSRHRRVQPVHVGSTIKAKATYYASRLSGRRTASGERFHQSDRTAATNLIPLESKAAVTNLRNGRSTEVRVTDRKPHRRRGGIDLSKAAAGDIGLTRHQGVTPVTIKVTQLPASPAH